MSKKVLCPSCYFEFEPIDGVIVGEIISCPDCGTDLEVLEIIGDNLKCQISEMSEES